MAMAKVVVLGGAGFLGANVVAALKHRGCDVESASRRTGVDAREEPVLLAYLERVKPEIVIHCAAHVGGIAYNARCPIAIFEDNLLLGFNVLRSAYRSGVKKLVNIMPNCTYPGEMDLYSECHWWDGALHPTVLTYGMPRKTLWVQAWAYQQQYGFRSIHLVLPNLYGPRDHFDIVRSHALGALIRKVVDAKRTGIEEVEIWGTGRPVREWLYVEDASEGIVREEAGWTGKFVYDPKRPDGAPCKILDVSKMKQVLGGWTPTTALRAGIRRTIGWLVEHEEEFQPGILG